VSPLLAPSASDWLDRRALEALALGAGRWRLAQRVAAVLRPRHVVRVGRAGFDLSGPFPEAVVDEGRIGDLRRHAGADLVWCDFALTDAPDVAGAIVALWRDAVDAAVALVDVAGVSADRSALGVARALRLREAPGLLAGLCRLFVPEVVEVVEHQEGLWRSLVVVARPRPDAR
jgi:hypothetical protein